MIDRRRRPRARDGGDRDGQDRDAQDRKAQDPAAAAQDEALRRALHLAAGLAGAGEHAAAREACGPLLLEAQPRLANDDDLLRLAVHALLVGRGFALLSRLLRALRGVEVRFELRADAGRHPARPTRLSGPGRVIFVLEPGWLAALTPHDPFVRQWHHRDAAVQDAPPVRRLQTA